ncbi:MAG TPA: hypothetical protein VL494_13640 [Steroidobacteraceae bacterium]|jgi:hypothetical protein|nr:hypothetical protein [Steroidobacteraceae bacterium]
MHRVFTISDTTPAAASTAVSTLSVTGLSLFPYLRVDADLIGATGGTLDIYLQRLIKPNAWADWLHFAQLASGASAIRYSAIACHALSTTITTNNRGTDAAPGVSLAAATFVGGHPGDVVRAVYVAGASTSAGAAITIDITGFGQFR